MLCCCGTQSHSFTTDLESAMDPHLHLSLNLSLKTHNPKDGLIILSAVLQGAGTDGMHAWHEGSEVLAYNSRHER